METKEIKIITERLNEISTNLNELSAQIRECILELDCTEEQKSKVILPW